MPVCYRIIVILFYTKRNGCQSAGFVERQVALQHRLECRQQGRLQNPVGVGDVLQHRPQRLELGLPGQCGDPGWRIGCQHVDPADHAQDVRRGLRLLQQESGLRFGRRRLHQYAAPDAARGTDGTPVVHRHVPVN